MAIFKEGGGGGLLDGNYVDTDKLGSGKGTPQGKKFLTDNQTFTNVDATQVDSTGATAGQVLTAVGDGTATWQDGGVTYTIREYTSSDTWTKPSGLQSAIVMCIAGASGGGSGRRGAAGTNRGGGGAGTGGGYSWQTFAADDLGATETVTVGAGGAGGAGVTTDDTSGNTGAAGGDTSFGTGPLVSAPGGNASTAGTTSSSSPAASNNTSKITQLVPFGASNGFGGKVGAGAIAGSTGSNGFGGYNALQDWVSAFRLGGGASAGLGGGLNTSNVERNGGQGGGADGDSGSLTGGTGGTANSTRDGGNGTDNANLTWFFTNLGTYTKGWGSAGGGGASESDGVTAAGNGGNGGTGSGGGGGGASANGADSGTGGNGGGGLCIVIEVTA